MNKKPLIILGVVALLFLGIISLVPSHYVVEHNERIDAPEALVFGYFEDLHRWNEWSRLDSVDPAVKKTFEGPASGKGAKMHWAGNEAVGEGDITITETSAPDHLAYDVAWLKPEVSQAHVQVDLLKRAAVSPAEAAAANAENAARDAGRELVVASPEGTLVTVKVDGVTGFGERVFALAIDRKRAVGNNLEAELEALKYAAGTAAAKMKPPEAPVAVDADAGTVDAGTP